MSSFSLLFAELEIRLRSIEVAVQVGMFTREEANERIESELERFRTRRKEMSV